MERLRSALNGSGESLERLSSEFYQVPGTTFPPLCLLPIQHAYLGSCWYQIVYAVLCSAVRAHNSVSRRWCVRYQSSGMPQLVRHTFACLYLRTHPPLPACMLVCTQGFACPCTELTAFICLLACTHCLPKVCLRVFVSFLITWQDRGCVCWTTTPTVHE